jgi:SAM-dependent methyltransferase
VSDSRRPRNAPAEIGGEGVARGPTGAGAQPAEGTAGREAGAERRADEAGAERRADEAGAERRADEAGAGEPEAVLRRFHAARPGITSAALAGAGSYARLVAAVPRGARVLDLGCGDTHLLGRLGPRAIGVDLAPSRGGDAAAAIVAGRAQALPFADRSFDACVCHLAFMLFDELDQVVAELRRVVVPGGVFAAVLGGGPTAADAGDDAFHRFLAIATPRGPGFGDRRARTEHGWHALFGAAPRFERFELDRSGTFDEVWRFLATSYQLADDDAPAARARLAASYAGRAVVPCRVVLWLATIRL